MKRILCIVGGMNTGGAETFLMKIYRALDKTKYQMDFAVGIKEKGFYDDEILSMGGKIHKISPKSQGFLKNFLEIKNLVKKEKYQSVIRISQNSLSALELLAAKLGGAKIRAFRSSNTDSSGGKIDKLIHKLCKFMPKLFANVRIAPSTEAAEFMFGKGCVKKGKAVLLHNAVDLDFFKYSDEARSEIRKEYDLQDKLVVVHIGRFNHQKNHTFLLDVFSEIKTAQPDAKLLLVGTGELESQIKQKTIDLGLDNDVLFLGVRKDIPNLLSAADVFLFPSFFEGMPNTVIEAQSTGLACIVADTITREANITELVEYLPLDKSAKYWADKTVQAAKTPRIDSKPMFIENQYDIEGATNQFAKIVFGEE